LNSFTGKDLIREHNGQVYTDKDYTGWGYSDMAKFEVNLK
jgi:hypothetical protein